MPRLNKDQRYKLNKMLKSKRAAYMARYPKTVPRPVRTYVQRVVNRNLETKVKYLSILENQINSVSSRSIFYDPMKVSNGTSFDERVGNKIQSRGLDVRGILHNNSTSNTMYVRMFVFRAKDQANFTNTSPVFLNGLGAEFTPDDTGNSLNNMVWPFNKRLIQPLYNRVIKLGPRDVDAGADHTKFFRKFIKLNNKHDFEDLSGGGADNVSNRIHVAFVCGEADADDEVGNIVEINLFTRFYYKDG